MEQNNNEYSDIIIENIDVAGLMSQLNTDGKKKAYDTLEKSCDSTAKKMALAAESCGMEINVFADILEYSCNLVNKKERVPYLHFNVRLLKNMLKRQGNIPEQLIDFVVFFINESLNRGYSTTQAINIMAKIIEYMV